MEFKLGVLMITLQQFSWRCPSKLASMSHDDQQVETVLKEKKKKKHIIELCLKIMYNTLI